MNKLPSGVPIEWEWQGDYFRKQTVTPKRNSKGEIEYVLYMGHKIGHHLCDSYVNGEGQVIFGGRKFGFDMVVRSKKEIHSFHGCY